jgi:hypothetical protein
MDWTEISIAVGCALPFLSVAFIAMAVTRYFRAETTVESKRWVLRSFVGYGLYWIALFAPLVTRDKTDFVAGDIFFWVTLLLGLWDVVWQYLIFGLRSRQASGRRVALASASMIVVYGGILHVNLVGKVGG